MSIDMTTNQDVVKVKDQPKWVTNLISCWNSATCKMEQLHLKAAVEQTRDQWNNVDYRVSKSIYDTDHAGIKSMMKKLGYSPLYETTSYIHFQHYTNKIKTKELPQ